MILHVCALMLCFSEQGEVAVDSQAQAQESRLHNTGTVSEDVVSFRFDMVKQV